MYNQFQTKSIYFDQQIFNLINPSVISMFLITLLVMYSHLSVVLSIVVFSNFTNGFYSRS